MLVRPKMNYKLLGTGIQLSKDRVYEAVVATNQPDHEEKGLIFCDEVLLEAGEYEIIEEDR